MLLLVHLCDPYFFFGYKEFSVIKSQSVSLQTWTHGEPMSPPEWRIKSFNQSSVTEHIINIRLFHLSTQLMDSMWQKSVMTGSGDIISLPWKQILTGISWILWLLPVVYLGLVLHPDCLRAVEKLREGEERSDNVFTFKGAVPDYN